MFSSLAHASEKNVTREHVVQFRVKFTEIFKIFIYSSDI